MVFNLRRRSGLPNASAFVAHQACHCCFYMIFLAFPAFFLDTMEETYNMDPSLSIYPKKSPFKPMCCLLSRFLAGPLGYTVRPPGKIFFCHPSYQRPARPKRHAKSMLEKTSSRNFEKWATWRDYFYGKRHIKQIRIK